MRIGVTGISGSLGGALIELLADSHTLVGITRDELRAEKVMARHPNVRCMVVAAGLSDEAALRRAFEGCGWVIHAAALKRISGSVYATDELIKTNIVGTMTVLQVARDIGATKAVVVSSDKAVQPTNLYGATKQCCEALAVQANSFTVPQGLSVSAVRYGNVNGSRGSVIHIWREQIRRDGVIQLTDPQMTRFSMSLRQAAELVSAALFLAEPGQILVPQLPAIRLQDLALAVMEEAGMPPSLESIRVVGLRPGGEKIHEHLFSSEEYHRTWLTRFGPYAVLPSHRSWSAEPYGNIRLDLDSPSCYSSAVAERVTAEGLREILKQVPTRPSDE